MTRIDSWMPLKPLRLSFLLCDNGDGILYIFLNNMEKTNLLTIAFKKLQIYYL